MSLQEMFAIIWGLLNFRIPIGTQSVTITSLVLYFFVLCGFWALSRLLRRLISKRLFPRTNLARSTEYLILKVTHYVVMIVGLFVVLGSLGVDLSSLTVLAGLLSVGIGFGLQNLAANFVSGIILLVEQPVKVGDWVELDGLEGEVKEINLRATGIETNDAVYIIVPNQDLLTSRVINGSLGASFIRTRTAVGVSYASDMKLVHDTLLAVAASHPKVLTQPPPEIWMVGFGDSSVNFEILAYIQTPKDRLRTQSELYAAAWWALKNANIEIPFPQRDLHIRSSDVELLVGAAESGKVPPPATPSA